MIGLDLSLTGLVSRGGGPAGPQIALSPSSIAEGSAVGTAVGALSVSGGTGTYTFTRTADPDAKFVVNNVILAAAGAHIAVTALTATGTAGAVGSDSFRASSGIATGSAYFEVTATNFEPGNGGRTGIGLISATSAIFSSLDDYLGSENQSIAFYSDGSIYINGDVAPEYPDGFDMPVEGDVIGVHLNATAKTVKFRVNGGSFSNAISLASFSGALYAAGTIGDGDVLTFNFGDISYAHSAPGGVGNFPSATPNVTTRAGVNYETKTAHSLTVGADNGVDTPLSRAFSIGVVDVAPTISLDGGGATAAVNAISGETAVTTVAASDPGGGTISYAITGGADAAFFQINSSSGALTFSSAPDVGDPQDTNADNVYEVQVTATCGALSDMQAISVTVMEDPGTVAFAATLDDSNDGNADYSLRFRFSVTAGGTQAKVRFQAGTNAGHGLKADHVSIGVADPDGNGRGTLSAPNELLFAGVSGFDIAAGAMIESDWVTLSDAFTISNSLMVVMDVSSDANKTDLGWRSSSVQDFTLFYQAGADSYDQAAVGNWSGAGNRVDSINRVTVR